MDTSHRPVRAAPDRVRAAADRLAELLGEPVRPVRKRALVGNRHKWGARTDHHVIYIAHDEQTSDRIVLEAQRIEWARSQGISTPPVVDANQDWLVYGRVASDLPRGDRCVQALFRTNGLIEDARTIPPGKLVPFQGWRPSRIRLAMNQWRLYRKGIDVAEFHRLRRAARSLPHDALSHGDLNYRNVLYDAAHGELRVIDWETLTYQPRFLDLLRLWPRLIDLDDRAHLLDLLVEHSTDLESLGLLHLYATVWNLNRLARDEGEFGGAYELPAGVDYVEVSRALVTEARERAASWRS